MNKEILFEDIKCGNLSAFEALFRQYYPSMCVIAGKLVANREVAEDIVQDVFIRLWEKKAEYDKIPDFRTFLYFLPQIVSRIFAVMRPDPDLTQTGAKTRWIY